MKCFLPKKFHMQTNRQVNTINIKFNTVKYPTIFLSFQRHLPSRGIRNANLTNDTFNSAVDMDTFLRPDDLDVDAVLDEMREGETGFVVLPGFFEKEEIQHAKELSLYLVN